MFWLFEYPEGSEINRFRWRQVREADPDLVEDALYLRERLLVYAEVNG